MSAIVQVGESQVVLRQGPGVNYELVGRVELLDELYIGDSFCNGSTLWLSVSKKTESRFAWIAASATSLTIRNVDMASLQPDHPDTCTLTAAGVLRDGPGTWHERIGSVEQGTTCRIKQVYTPMEGKPWYRVTVDGETGWISSGVTR